MKGGGGGSFGIVTRLTLRTRELPEFFGAMFVNVAAKSDAAYRDLIERFVAFYREKLFNPQWGEQVTFRRDNVLGVAMVFQGLDGDAATAVWKPFFDWLAARPNDFALQAPPFIAALPARHFWDAAFLKANAPDFVLNDDRPGAPSGNVFWRSNIGEAGWFIQGYGSVWMPGPLIEPANQPRLVDALFAATRQWRVTLHFNKGLAGAPAEEVAAARDTATNPAARRRLRARHQRLGGAAGFSGHSRSRARHCAGKAQRQEHQRRHGRAAQAGAEPRLLRLGIELLRARLAWRLLGCQLCAAARR